MAQGVRRQEPQAPGDDGQSHRRGSHAPGPPPLSPSAIGPWLPSVPRLRLRVSSTQKASLAAPFLFASQLQSLLSAASLRSPPTRRPPSPRHHGPRSTSAFLEPSPLSMFSLLPPLCAALCSVPGLQWTPRCPPWLLLYPGHPEQCWRGAGVQLFALVERMICIIF